MIIYVRDIPVMFVCKLKSLNVS